MKKIYLNMVISTFSFLLLSCGGGDTPVSESNPVTAVADNGEIFFKSNCGGCHAAGSDDNKVAFGASDLAQLQDKIKSDMSTSGAVNIQNVGIVQLMGRFSALSPQRIADLKAYLALK